MTQRVAGSRKPLHQIAEDVGGRIGDARHHGAAVAGAAACIYELGSETGIGGRGRDGPSSRRAAQVALFKAWIGDLDLCCNKAGKEKEKQNAPHGQIVAYLAPNSSAGN